MTWMARAASFKRRAEPGRVHGLNRLEQFGGFARLIGLQVADEVEARAREIGDRGRLAFEFPHVVLAEIPQAQGVRFVNRGCREDFSDRQQKDGGGVAPRAAGGAGHAVANGPQPGFQGIRTRRRRHAQSRRLRWYSPPLNPPASITTARTRNSRLIPSR